MTAAQFRKLALSLPEAVESQHMGHPDFRVGGKIFATLWPDGVWGMVKLEPEAQADLCADEPEIFQVWPGGWGRLGCTRIILKKAPSASVRRALTVAWLRIAARRLHEKLKKHL
jgi:hypothetical protein